MKIIMTLITVITVITTSLSQSKSDTVNLDNINYELLNSLFLEKVNKIRDSIKVRPLKMSKKYSQISIYHTEYMTEYDILTHENAKQFKGLILNDLKNRVKYFDKDLKIEIAFEVCVFHPIKFYNVKTYEEIVNNLVLSYMNSPHHNLALTYDNKIYQFYFSSSFKLNKKKDKLYHSGFVGMTY